LGVLGKKAKTPAESKDWLQENRIDGVFRRNTLDA